jgi:hypothetical protein
MNERLVLGPFYPDTVVPVSLYVDKGLLVKEGSPFPDTTVRTFFENGAAARVEIKRPYIIPNNRNGVINCQWAFLLSNNGNFSGHFSFQIDKKIIVIGFPLTEEEFYQTNLSQIPLVDGLLKVPFIEDPVSRLQGNFVIPRPWLEFPRNQFLTITPQTSLKKVYQAFQSLGFGVVFEEI